jgi:NADH/F420H2 dehydrogenase subunit C
MKQNELQAYIEANYAGQMTFLDTGRSEPVFEVKLDELVAVATRLRDDPELKFDFLCNLGAVDTREKFEVCYHIASVEKKLRLDFKVTFPYEGAAVDTVTPVWPGANWYERELYELYGIEVKNHPDMRPLLLPDDWDQGFPMRKDWDAPDFIRMPEL